jgi:HlyD family secretion protein
VIRSPVSGVVVDRQIDVGQTVAASFQTPTLFKIAQDLTQMQIYTTFAEADIGAIRVDQPVRFNVDAFPNRSFRGKVKQIRLNPTTQQNVVTYNVVVAVENPEQILLPGMTAYVNIVVAPAQGRAAGAQHRAALQAGRTPRRRRQAGGGESQRRVPPRRPAGARRAKSARSAIAGSGTVHVLEDGQLKPVKIVHRHHRRPLHRGRRRRAEGRRHR